MSAYAPNPTYENNEDSYAPLTASLLARKGEAMPAVDATAHAGVDIDMAPMMPGMEPANESGGGLGAGLGSGPGKGAARRRGARGAQGRPAMARGAGASRPEPVHAAPAGYAEAHNDHDALSPDPYETHTEDDYNPVVYAPNDVAPNDHAGDAVVDAEPVPAARFNELGGGEPGADEPAGFDRFPGAAPSAGDNWKVSGPSIEARRSGDHPLAIEDPVRAFPEGAPADGAALEDVKARLRRRAKRASEPGKAGRKATITFRMPARDLVRLRFASRELGVMCQTIILEALECYLEANDVAPISDADFAAETDRLMRLKKEKARKRSG